MKNAVITILVIAVIVLSAITFMMHQKINALTTDVCVLTDQLTVNEVKLETFKEPNMETKKDTAPKAKKEKNDVKFDSEKMKISANGVYEVLSEDSMSLENIGIAVKVEEGKAYISTEFDKEEWISQMYDDPTEVENQEITGFEGEPVMCFMAMAGQDINPPTLCFLMDDGSVEYVNSKDMLKSEEYQVKGQINELENIVSFEYVSVSEPDGLGGYISTVAIDEDGYSYDIFEIDL